MKDKPIKGRGVASNAEGRFSKTIVEDYVDDWAQLSPQDSHADSRLATNIQSILAKSIVSQNQSPDLPFSQSINPYLGCEHGCVYCYARPSHSYLELSPGLDFETQLFAKDNAPELLEQHFQKANYIPSPILIGANTDAYQPAEKTRKITRRLLELMLLYKHPVQLITKSDLILRDIDLLAELAEQNLCSVMVSVTSLDNELKRRLEPRAASAAKRLAAITGLNEAKVPIGALLAPIIPAINDNELESMVNVVAEAGASHAAMILLRLPHEVAPLFREWLSLHYPDRSSHVMSLVQQMRGGKDYDSSFEQRMTGSGVFAQLLHARFKTACQRAGLNTGEHVKLDTGQFNKTPYQQPLF